MISILSRFDIRRIVNKEPNQHVCIVISEPEHGHAVADILPLCKEVLHLEFHDVSYGKAGPTLEHVQKAIDWAKERMDAHILVACAAGVSRSSSIAYLIQCARTEPESAALILDPEVHYPNTLVIEHGRKILGESIWPPVKDFYSRALGYWGE